MKRKHIIYLVGILMLISCQDNLLEKYPLSSVSPETFFKKGDDFKLYVNQFYDGLGDNSELGPSDIDTDNHINLDPNLHLDGMTVNDVTDNAWNSGYSYIRKVNIMLANTGDVNFEEVKTYLGEARFFRAWQYFKLLQRFGGVPWISEPLLPTDLEKLKTPRAKREVLVDSIVADLDFAIANIPSVKNTEKLRLNKETALAFKSRVCLYEGTWEKHHGIKNTPFKVEGSNGTKFLQKAADAALQVINGGNFSVEKTGVEPYFNLFNREDYSSSTEVILWRKNDRNLRVNNRSVRIYSAIGNGGLTKNLIEDYLATDGLPMGLTSLELSDSSLPVVIQNRDPRLAQTIFYPGVVSRVDDATGVVTEYYARPILDRAVTGYHYRKGASQLESNLLNSMDQIAWIYFRFGEVLLNYIEAKAELNQSGDATLTQNDFDISINKLRDRVGMPHFNLGNPIIDQTDPFTGEIPWYLVEIRRERRIELATENFRWNDIFRWAAADDLIKGKIFIGAPFQWYIDRGWYKSGQITYVDKEGYLSPWYGLSVDLNGGYNFHLDRDYLYPLPLQEITLAKYENNPGW